MAEWREILNYGVPIFILFALGVGAYRVITWLGTHAVEPWVKCEQHWRKALTERLENQQKLCGTHAECLEKMDDTLRVGQELAAQGNRHLSRLVEIHEKPGELVHESVEKSARAAADVARLKRAAIHACDMCEHIVSREFPNSEADVKAHCQKIKDIIHEA